MKAYHFDHATGVLTGVTEAQPNPMQDGQFLLPRCSTFIVPPEGPPGTLPIFADGQWTLADDHRGATYWLGAKRHVMTEPGALPEGAVTEMPVELRKAEARRQVIACCNSFAAPILARYPVAEQAGWDKREAEAKAIVAASDGGGDVAAAIAATLIVAALATAAGWSEAQTVDHARSIIAKAAEAEAAACAATHGLV